MEIVFTIKVNSDPNQVAVTLNDQTHLFTLPTTGLPTTSAATTIAATTSTPPPGASISPLGGSGGVSLSILTWNVDNWSTRKNHTKSITAAESADYAQRVRQMLQSMEGGIPTLLGMQEYGVVFDQAGAMTTDTALADYPATGHFEWLKQGQKADYWAPGGFANNSSMVNGLPARVLYDALWLWGPYATRAKCKAAGYELQHYYDGTDGTLTVPNGLKESDVKTPMTEFAHVLELTIDGRKVAWANAHFFPKSQRKDYPYNKDVVNWMCLRNLMYVLRSYDYVIISGDLNWSSAQFMLDYDEAVACNNSAIYPRVTDAGGEANRYKYAGAGKQGYVTADYALYGYGQTGNRGEDGATDIDRLNTVDCILAKGLRITKVRKVKAADWFDKDHRPVWAKLETLS